ncbi:MAG: NAD(P)H-hydrate dehydratase [Hyphomicrobiales bacterium]|nr:NAD(P)H-hydrate dehydratase [Hyphomicrobiales bacterium]
MSVELLTTNEMAEADRLTIAGGTPGVVLMEAAGRAVAERAAAMIRKRGGTKIAVLCGPGANGGDGYVAAHALLDMGFDVEAFALGDPGALKGDAAWAFQLWSRDAPPIDTFDLDHADFIIDALFGAGLARDLDGAAYAMVERVNAWRRDRRGCVLAVDVPSGVDGSTGAVRGAAIEADATVTFFRLKPGHLLLPARKLCGATTCADIGIGPNVIAPIAPRTFWNEPDLWRAHLPVPKLDSHKYARGHALVLSGPMAATGAARLAARGALRAGAGLVTVASSSDALMVNALALTAIMVRRSDGPRGLAALLADARMNAVVLGPGLGVGEDTCALVETALAAGPSRRACVLDADALTSFAGAPDRLFAAIGNASGATVLTPHAGEFARLFARGEGSKLSHARSAAERSGAIVVYKGPDTVVAAPDGRASIASNAPAWLATAGSGDVLAGIICGLLAQDMPAFEAASAGVWMHGAAANAFGPGLIAEDIPDALPKVWRALAP